MDLVRQGCPPALVAKLAERLPQIGLSSPPLGSPRCSVCPDVFLGRASWGISAGCPLSTLPPCCALRAQEQPGPLGQGCHHSGTSPSSTRCPPHSVMPGHPALSASPAETQVIYGGESNFLCQKSHFLQPDRAQGTCGLHRWAAKGSQCRLTSLLVKMKGPKPLWDLS